MIEILLLALFGTGLVGSVVAVVKKGVTSRKFHYQLDMPAPEPQRMALGSPVQLAIEAPRHEIPEDIRRELDKTPEEAWEEAFHTILNASPSREVKAILSHYTYDGDDLPEHTALRDCPCADCKDA